MDSDNEMIMHQLMQDEEDAAADEEENLLIMSSFLVYKRGLMPHLRGGREGGRGV
jgi:hypothetical protein